MNILKSIYVSAFLSAALALSGYSIWQLSQAENLLSPWLGTLIASAGPSLFFIRLFALPIARTPNRLWGTLSAGLIGSALAYGLGGSTETLLALSIGVVGTLVYDYWFSRFNHRNTEILAPGKALPNFELQDADGNIFSSATLNDKPSIWMFYRGNWCPFCVAQIKELASQYRELEQRGAQVILISPQSEAHTRSLAKKFDIPMKFLIDTDNQAARKLDIFVKNGLPTGMQALGYDSDVPMPTVFITDANGTIIYADLTDNYRIRPEPDEFLRVLDEAQAAA